MDELETLCEPCHKARSDLNKMFMALSTRDALRYYRLILCDPEVESWAIMAIDCCITDEDFEMRLHQGQHSVVMNAKNRQKVEGALKRGDVN